MDMRAFIARQDPVWTEIPTFWDEGPFLGNGVMGALVYVDKESGRLHIKPGRTDIYDNRPLEKYTIMDKQFAQGRLQLGPVEIGTRGRVTGCEMRLSLYDATLSGSITTECGSVEITGEYPAWEYKKDSHLRDVMKKVYEDMYNKSPEIVIIHAGLECGIITSSVKNLSAVAVGCNVIDLHTPMERMELDSYDRIYDTLVELLK